jgi:hypothetical protein
VEQPNALYSSLPRHPDNYVLAIALTACAAVIVGTIIPAFVAYHAQVFYFDQMRVNLESSTSEKLKPVKTALLRQKVDRERIDDIDEQLAKTPSNSSLISTRATFQSDLEQQQQSIAIHPFFLSDLMFAWSGMYICFATVAFTLGPHPRTRQTRSWKLLISLVLVYLIYQSPVWLRNSVLTSEGRKVFSFANRDIAPTSFYMQEINTLVWFALLFFVWRKWLRIYDERQRDLQQKRAVPIDIQVIDQLTKTFVQWQVNSLVISVGFIIFTGIFWDFLIIAHDKRYLLPAVVMHTLWAFTWWLASLPLLATWQEFSHKKMELLLRQASDGRSDDYEEKVEALQNLSPISSWNGLGSIVAGLASFAIPALHAIIK